jgi:multiple sugar transport system permease protein
MAKGNRTTLSGLVEAFQSKLTIWRLQKLGRTGAAVFRTYMIICLSFVVLYPIFYMISATFRSPVEILDPAVIWVPKHWTLENLTVVLKLTNFLPSLKNTAWIALSNTVLQIVSCSLAGYGFARFRFRGRKILFGLVLLSIVVPAPTVAIPLFMQIRFFDFFGIGNLIGLITGKALIVSLYNTPFALLVPSLLANGIRGGLYIYIFRQFFMGMPLDLEDAAYIDGCGFVRTFTKIVVPLAVPPMLVTFLLSLIWYWNDVFATSLFYSSAPTLSSNLEGMYGRLWNLYDTYQIAAFQQAASLLLIVPVLLVYLFMQRYFIQSIDRTGFK